jgi:forkhead box protein K
VDQEARIQPGKGLDGETGKPKKKSGVSVLEPPLKRSVKGDAKGGPLPPPLTSTPLAPRKFAPFGPATRPLASHESASPYAPVAFSVKPGSVDSLLPHSIASTGELAASAPTSMSTSTPLGESPAVERGSIPSLPPSLFIPIVVGPIPPSHSSSSLPTDSNPNPLASNAIVLHDSTLILNPEVFSHLTPAQVKELEALGAQKALEILQGYIARYLKEQRLKNRTNVRGRGRGRNTPRRGRGGSVKAGDGAPATGEGSPYPAPEGKPTMVDSGPFTTVPLPPWDVQPRLNGDVATLRTTRSPARAVVPTTCVDAKSPDSVSVADPGSAPCDLADAIIVVDDSDSSDSPAAKRRKLDGSIVPPIC